MNEYISYYEGKQRNIWSLFLMREMQFQWTVRVQKKYILSKMNSALTFIAFSYPLSLAVFLLHALYLK